MNNLTKVVLGPLENSIYVKPLRINYTQDGKEKTWDAIKAHNSVAILIYNISRDVLVLVKQFRPPVYFGNLPNSERQSEIDVEKHPADLGITLELCAGIVDKNLALNQIAAEEVLEECGYQVLPENLERVTSYCADVGVMGTTQTLYYCEVTDEMRVCPGGGIHDELIDVVEMTVPQMEKYVNNNHILSPPSFLFGIYWFLHKKWKH